MFYNNSVKVQYCANTFYSDSILLQDREFIISENCSMYLPMYLNLDIEFHTDLVYSSISVITHLKRIRCHLS